MQKACSICCRNSFLESSDHHHHHHTSDSAKTQANNPRIEFMAATVSSIQPNTSFTNHESLPPFTDMYSNLQKAFPFYSKSDLADQIRLHEYSHLAESNHVYLDYIGHGLFSYSQLLQGSPKVVPFFDISHEAASLNSLLRNDGKSSEFELAVKERVMKYMNISEEDYSVVFTANQTSSFNLLVNSYPFQSNNKLLTVYDYRNEAVEAMVASSVRKGATAMAAKFSWPSLRINSKELRKMIMQSQKGRKKKKGLFVFPLQSRMTGERYSYQWMNFAQENGWHVLLDADALKDKEMETLGLTLFRPDFIVSSFFKVFGENPSGFTSLFVKKSIISELNKSHKAIGIVSLVPTFWNPTSKYPTLETLLIEEEQEEEEENPESQEIKFEPKMKKEPSFSTFLTSDTKSHENQASSSGINKIEFKGLDHADEVGLVLISSRVRYHVNWLVNALLCLKHPHSENGVPLVKLYGPNVSINRGPYVAFNVFDWKGEKVDPFMVQKLADRNGISLACGILQHMWFREKGKKAGKLDSEISVMTVSIGFLNNFEDLYRFWAFVSRFLDADFVEKERWRYMAINQTTVEV